MRLSDSIAHKLYKVKTKKLKTCQLIFANQSYYIIGAMNFFLYEKTWSADHVERDRKVAETTAYSRSYHRNSDTNNVLEHNTDN